MGIRRQLVRSLLKKYVQNLRDRHIHVDIRKGTVQIDDAILELEPLADLLSGILPGGCELVQARASEIRLKVPWKELKTRSTILQIGTIVVIVKRHPCVTCGLSETPCGHWAAQLTRHRVALHEEFSSAKRGGAEARSLVQVVVGGLQIAVDSVDVSFVSCDRDSKEESETADVPPHARLRLDDLSWTCEENRVDRMVRFSPVESLASTSRVLTVGALSVSVDGGSGLRRLLLPTPLTCRIKQSMPSDGKLVCPFLTSARIDVDLRDVCVEGDGEQLRSLFAIIADFNDADELLSRQLGPLPWSDEEHDALSSEAAATLADGDALANAIVETPAPALGLKPPSLPLRSSSTGALRTTHHGETQGSSQKRSGSRSGILRRLMPGHKKSSGAKHADASDSHLRMPSPQQSDSRFRMPSPQPTASTPASTYYDDDSDREDGTGSVTTAGGLDDIDDLPYLPATESLQKPEDMDEDASVGGDLAMNLLKVVDRGDGGHGVDHVDFKRCSTTHHVQAGRARQTVLILQASAVRVGVMLSNDERAELVLSGLGYRRVKHGWLTESQQTCVSRLGGRFAGAVAGPTSERGAASPDGILSAQHEASIQTCHLSCSQVSSASPQDGTTVSEQQTQSLIQHAGTGKEEMLTLSWQSQRGLPCRASTITTADASKGGGLVGEAPTLFVWPVEAVVRGASVHYVADRFKELRGFLGPFLSPAVDWDNFALPSVANDIARSARRAKAIVIRNVRVQQSATLMSRRIDEFSGDEGKKGNAPDELPHSVWVQSAVLENVSDDMKDLCAVFGLARFEEQEPDVAITGQNAESMSTDELRAEVLMWRSKAQARIG